MKRWIAAVVATLAASTVHAGSQVVANKAALSTVSPIATKVGLNVLRNGGNAIDAAVAVSFALAVVHPQAGNLGGGGFLMYYDAAAKGIWALDYREVAPRAATRDMYLSPDGTINRSIQVGPLAGGVPGTVSGLGAMHARFGSRPWRELLAPAISLARDGHLVERELALALKGESSERSIEQFASTAAIFFPDKKPVAEQTKLVQPELAATLDRIAVGGAADFYKGELAKRIVNGIRAHGGIIAFRDLREYEPVWRAPIRIHYEDHDIYTMPPPSAAALIIGETLAILSGYELRKLGFQTPEAIHLQIEAERRAYIDRIRVLGDPATARIALGELLSAARAEAWRKTITPNRITSTASLGEGTQLIEGNHTTHFSIADEQGNVAAITTTLNDDFGSGFVVPGCGFFLNNEMDDFSAAPGKPNRYGMPQSNANAIAPGKRMASSMSPTIVMKDGKPLIALGTLGGPTIPTTVLQVLINVITYGKTLDEAIAAPRFHHQAWPDEIRYERVLAAQETVDALSNMGHPMTMRDAIGDVHALMFRDGKIFAVADPRHGGAAGGY